ncbi:lipoyl domain-containing protein [Mycobacterium avium]|uniref:lipoyl domain-containing protein n=1 Tax=Mycobacterium avium TaxID=1764 RepID=UPI0018C8673D|nr:lipoyl domain-containing protein [Mycobacterium avium]
MVVYVPRPGLSVNEVTVVDWLVSNGEVVEEGDQICDLGTDKTELSIEAPASGVLTHTAAVDDVLAVGAELGRITPSGPDSP